MINILNKEVINLIKAGEVVESINSIVKELVENSLDAESKNIKIILEKDTFFKLTIIDDGIGIKKDDIKISILSHTTSKIKDSQDLENINTYGFRGEALASILSISDLLISSKPKSQEFGYFEKYENQKLIDFGIKAQNNGTIIVVENIFKNTPVRLKYLKSDNVEKSKVYETVKAMAISRPDVSFELIIDDKQLLYTTGSNLDLENISEIFGKKYLEDILVIEEKTKNHLYKIILFSKEFLKNNKNDILLFLNGRFIKNFLLKEGVCSGFRQFLMQGKYPMAIVKIWQNSNLSDVNIHPQKLEVKILNEFALKTKIELLIKDKLNSNIKNINNFLENKDNQKENNKNEFESLKNTFEFDFSLKTSESNINLNEDEKIYSFDGINQDLDYKNNINSYNNLKDNELINNINNEINTNVISKEENILLKEFNYKYEARLFNTYLLFSSFDNLILVDQHAASERVRYENLLKNFNNSYLISLLIPYTLFLEKEKIFKIKDNIEHLKEFGFYFNNELELLKYPSYINKKEIENSIIFLIENKDKNLKDFKDSYLKQIACKGAIKQGDVLSKIEVQNLIIDLFKCNNPYQCIHSRPSLFKFSKNDLDKMFKRIL